MQYGRWSGQQQDQHFYDKFSENYPNCNLSAELIPMKNVKYVCSWTKGLFSEKIPAVPLAGRLKDFITNYGILTQQQLVSSERLQNTIFNISSTTEKSNGDLRNLGNVEKGCSSQNAVRAATWSS